MPTLTELSYEAEEAVRRFAYGCKNTEAVSYFQMMERRMRDAPHYHAGEKIVTMRSFAEILYSARRHRRYADGAETVRMILLQALSVMRSIEQMYKNKTAA